MKLEKVRFTRDLLKWHKDKNHRIMPWKGEKNPYKIWLSEVILQQTRVEQGRVYYENFLAAFPAIHDLAVAPEQKVFKLWEGLGYYNRCRNLIATAKKIDAEYNGEFPAAYDALLSLKGIGPYTAAAIASFAFRLPHAVIDGNVTRVLSRYFGDFTPIDSTAGKKLFSHLADELLDREQSDIYNQAIMDFGATVCLPRNPLCDQCIHRSCCRAHQQDWTAQLPVKEKSVKKRQRWFYYFIVMTPDDRVYIRQRMAKDIWRGLFEFILRETDRPLTFDDFHLPGSELARQLFGRQSLTVKYISRIHRQELTHQTILGQFITIGIDAPLSSPDGYVPVSWSQLTTYAFPRFINAWLQEAGSASAQSLC
jgi:A/G-specific adenine glycosylase